MLIFGTSDVEEVKRPITDTDVRYYGFCVYSFCSVMQLKPVHMTH